MCALCKIDKNYAARYEEFRYPLFAPGVFVLSSLLAPKPLRLSSFGYNGCPIRFRVACFW